MADRAERKYRTAVRRELELLDRQERRLREAVDRAGRMEQLRFELPLSRLEYQLFSDMNRYIKSRVGGDHFPFKSATLGT